MMPRPYTPNERTTNRVCVRAVWSNFEIASLDLWRGEGYSKFFEHLDRAGGFYYEVRTTHDDYGLGALMRGFGLDVALGRCACA
jgi:hypothetical protein